MKIVIGISIHAEPSGLRATLDGLRAHTKLHHEIILLADGPDQPTRTALAAVRDFRQLGTEEPRGTPACFNRLVSSSRSELYLLLESGVVVGPNWLDQLIAALRSDPRNGLAGPSTNRSWNAQAIFAAARGTPAEIAHYAQEASRRFGNTLRTLEPLHSLADFCYAVRREVIESIGLADEGYGLGPCWEMDYNIRAARAGWRGVWVCGAYVHRAPFTARRRQEEARFFEASKRRYQDRFCGARLRGEKNDYRTHCRGDACPNFARGNLIRIKDPEAHSLPPSSPGATLIAPCVTAVTGEPLVSCIMPTYNRLRFVPEAVRCFQKQDYPNLELVIVDDGTESVEPVLPTDPRLRLIRLSAKKTIGAKRNVACSAARGEFIVHWDDDDWYPCNRISRQIAALRAGRAEICGTSTLFYHDAAAGRAWCYRYSSGSRAWVAGNTLAYRKHWWTTHRFPEIQVGEDTRFVWTAPPAVICDLAAPALCVARVHKGNTSRKQTNAACWEPRPTDEVRSLLGDDWPRFAAVGVSQTQTSQAPVVSCIMPTYNRRSFLRLALEAFLAQDYPHKELVIVDDGEDQVGDLVRGLNSVRHIALERRTSIGRKRNIACQAARGSVIAHWDDDDWYGTSRLSYQVAPLIAGVADITGLENAFQLELTTGEFWRPTPELHRRMFVGDLHGGTLVYWKSLFEQGLRYPEINLAEDAVFLRQALQHGKRVLRLKNPGVFVYVRHGRNAWRFQAGQFLDRNGWERVDRPGSLSEDLLTAYRRAADPAETARSALAISVA